MNYGKEGVSYTMVDGNPSTPTLYSITQVDLALTPYYTTILGLMVRNGDFKRLWQGFEGTPAEAALDAYDVWNRH